jgi:hypothetical protein
MRQLLLFLFIACFCHTNGQVVLGVLGGYGVPLFDKGSKLPGDPKSASADFTLMEGGSLMVHAGKSVGLGVQVYGQTYSFTMHSGQADAAGYSGADLVHRSDYLFIAPTLSFIFDPRDYIQLNLSPAFGFITGGHEYVKNYSGPSGGNLTFSDSTNTTENLNTFIFCATVQLQENLAFSQHFRLCFIESYSYMASRLTQTAAVSKNIMPGYVSIQLALTYRIHKRSITYFTPSFL